MNRKASLKIVFLLKFLVLLFISDSQSFAQNSLTQLTLNKPLTSEIKGGESHFYSISLSANQTAQVEVIQNGVEISLSAYDPFGTRFLHNWSLSGLLGSEKMLVTAKRAGEYKVEVEPYFQNAVSGKYTIYLKKVRTSVPKDFEINQASILLTQTIADAENLRRKGQQADLLASIEKWNEVRKLSKIIGDRVWEAAALATQGVMYHDLGEFQKALDAYLKSLKIWQELGNRQNQGSLINNLGAIYQNLGEYEKAISYQKQALKFHRETRNFAGVSTVLNNMATNYSELGNNKEAEKLYRESIALDEKYRQGEYKFRLSNTQNNLAILLIKKKGVDEGVELFLKAMELRREIKDYSGVAHSLLFMGQFLWNSKDYKQFGYEKLLEAKKLAAETGDKVIEAQALYLLALAEQKKGDIKNIEKAINFVGRSISLAESIRGSIVDSKSRYGYFSTVQEYYELYIDLVISHHELTKDKQDIGIALVISEHSRSRSLLDLLKEAKVDFRKGNNLKLLESLKNLQRELNNKYAVRRQILGKNGTSAQITKVNNEINDLNTNIQKLKLRVRRENPKYADLSEGKVVSVKEMQNLLDENSILLQYKLGKKRSFVWLVTNDSIEYFILPPRKIIETKAKEFYELVVANKRADEAKRNKASEELSKILFSQFADKITKKRLAIVADGVLQYTPFSALLSPKSNALKLIDTNEIVMLPSASVLAQIRQNPIRNNSDKIAVFADPVFDNEDSRIEQKKNTKPSGTQNILIKQALRDFQFGEILPRLLASRQEAREISKLFGNEKSVVKMDFAAGIENLEKTNLSQFNILHFATHGLINTSRPELSGLVFSLYKKNGEEQNGFLSLNEIYNLQLSSDMVVLSACQTAFGKDVKGEGLIGLSRGFLYAGSNRVIASYWKVDDFATAEFMKRFYRNYLEKKMPASKALQQTKIEMKKIRRYQSPYYWSAFTLLGDWK